MSGEKWTREDWARKRLEIDTMLDEYEADIKAANEWYADWKLRQIEKSMRKVSA